MSRLRSAKPIVRELERLPAARRALAGAVMVHIIKAYRDGETDAEQTRGLLAALGVAPKAVASIVDTFKPKRADSGARAEQRS